MSRYSPKRTENIWPQNDLYMNIYSSTVQQSPKSEITQILSIGNLWYIHLMDYSSVIRINKLLIHVTTWINLKNIKHKKVDKKCAYSVLSCL